MKKTPKRSAVTVSVAAFVFLLVGVVLFTGVLPGLRAEKEESAAAPPDGAGYEAAIAVPAAQEDKACEQEGNQNARNETAEGKQSFLPAAFLFHSAAASATATEAIQAAPTSLAK